jgi:hypothetical protein
LIAYSDSPSPVAARHLSSQGDGIMQSIYSLLSLGERGGGERVRVVGIFMRFRGPQP